MDLLRRLGAMEQLEGRAAQNRRGIAAQTDTHSPQSSQRFCVAVWKRRAATGERGENVSRDPEGAAVAESIDFVGKRNGDHGNGRLGSKDDWALRVRATGLLAYR